MSDFLNKGESDDENWLPIADIMTSLFVIFLFIAIVAIQNVSKIKAVVGWPNEQLENAINVLDRQDKTLAGIGNIVSNIEDLKQKIYDDLDNEFKYDLPIWQAEIDPSTLVFRFKEPDILFQTNSSAVRPRFKKIISDFFPRYLRVLNEYFPIIDEIRIEGHTSSEWHNAKTEEETFLLNMQLSQDRTQSVLAYCLSIGLSSRHTGWIREKVTAKGFSSTRLIKREDGAEDKSASRRVEFRVYLDIEKFLYKINEVLKDGRP